jgi:hypothetical protein
MMMKKNNLFVMLAAALAVGSVFSCNQIKEEQLPQEPQGQEKTSVYTLTVEALKGASTKALTEDEVNHIIKSSWAEGDNVDVYNAGGEKLGTLTPAVSSTSSTTLSGNLDTAPAVEDVLTLKYRSGNYASQDGTLDYIATHCDYATAEVTVTEVVDKSITTTPAQFVNQQAIVKFTLRQSGDESLSVMELKVNVGTTTYTVAPVPPTKTSTFYVAVEGFSEQTVTLSANAGGAYYDRKADNVTFENGKFYRVTATMTPRVLKSISISGLNPAPSYYYGGALQIEAR